MTNGDLALTRQLINELKVELVTRPDDHEWFKTWTLRHAFSRENLKLTRDSLQRGDFAPCPLLMSDAAIADLDKLSLADAIFVHETQGYQQAQAQDRTLEWRPRSRLLAQMSQLLVSTVVAYLCRVASQQH